MNKLSWYMNRLQAMSSSEVRYRVGQRLQTERERVSLLMNHNGVVPQSQRGVHPPIGSNLYSCVAETDASSFAKWYPAETERLLQAADGILRGELILFNDQKVTLSEPLDWHQDPVTGKQWPRDSFYADIGSRWGGAKTIWETARQQYLITLAQAYWLTQEARFLEGIQAHLASWLAQNPPYRGIHWTSGLELGIRLISWAWVALLTQGAGLEQEAWRESIVAHGRYLAKHLSRFSSANNHLIGEACGLLLAGLLVPAWHEAEGWRKKGLAVLEEELLKQMLPDGSPAEQASHYLGFTLDFYLFLATIAETELLSLSFDSWSRLEAVGEFMMGLMDGQGNLPGFGDEDGGYAFILTTEHQELVRSRLATLAVLCKRPDFKASAQAYDARSWWLLGEAGAEKFAALPSIPVSSGSRAYPDGGYWLLRAGSGEMERALTFDCGPLGYLSLAAHGHADCLSIWLSLGGQPMLVDSGTYNYHEKAAWRSFFRSTAAHNTIRVDGQDQSQQTGPTIWGKRAEPTLIDFFEHDSLCWVEGQHNGYERLDAPIIHRRGIALVRETYFIVVDWLCVTASPADDGSGTHMIEQFFHLPPDATVALHQGKSKIVVGEQTLQIIPAITDGQSAQVVIGNEKPIQGWHSPRFGHKLPAPTLVYRWETECPQAFITLLWPTEAPPPSLEVSSSSSTGVCDLSVIGDGWRDEFAFDRHPAVDASGLRMM